VNNLTGAVRQLKRRPGLSVIIIAILAIGIGATTAMYSLFHEVLLRSLPVPESERLVNLSAPGPIFGPSYGGEAIGAREALFTYEMFRDLEAEQTVFTGLAGHADFSANIAVGTQASSGRGMLVSGSYFDVLNLQPALGRLLGPADEPRIDESAVVVLSYDYWRSQFGMDPSVVGRQLTVNGQPLTVVGVAPEGFHGTTLGWRPQVFVPLTLRWLMQPTMPRSFESRNSYWVYLFARLTPGLSLDEAAASLNVLYSGIINEVEAPMFDRSDDEMRRFREKRVVLEPGARGQSKIPQMAGPPATLLFGITSLVLLIVCVNVANLLLARGASRRAEMAIRACVGASRGRLAGQLLTESAVLAGLGGLASLPVAVWMLAGLTALIPQDVANGLAIQLSPPAVLFAAGASLVTMLLFGVAPAWRASDMELGRAVKGPAGHVGGARGLTRFRSSLTTAQIALSAVLLVLAGLFAQSLANVARVDLGIDVDSLVSFSVSPRLNGYSPEDGNRLYDRIEAELAAEPGVSGVASSSVPLLARAALGFRVAVPGFDSGPSADTFSFSNFISPGFLATTSMSLMAGRDFAERDRPGSQPVAIVNETFVRTFGLEDDAVGTHFSIPFVIDDLEIVGVVADAKYNNVKSEILSQFFLPRAQAPDVPQLYFYVRGAIDAQTLMRTVPRVVADLDPGLPVGNLIRMEQQVEANVYLDRLITMLSAGFAALATLLAAVGLYGVLAYNVTERTRELGLRLALGARPGNLRSLVLKQVGHIALVGGAIGLAAAIAAGRAAEALLFGLSGYDPRVLGAAAAVLAAVILGASYLPARRASRIAPMKALRYE